MINSNGGDEVPKVADFLGVSKSENPPDLTAYNQITTTHPDYFFSSDALQPAQNSAAATTNDYDSPGSATNLQSLTLSMGSAKGLNGESSSGNTAVEVTPRRSVDTFGQRTSIYRGVTRWISVYLFLKN